MSAEATVIRNYLDWVLSIPWNSKSDISKNIKKAKTILEDDHWLRQSKGEDFRVFSSSKKNRKIKGPILCLVGPPGLVKHLWGSQLLWLLASFVRMSLGGVRDEAEIRGHRKTYIGSMPGRFIQSMKKLKLQTP